MQLRTYVPPGRASKQAARSVTVEPGATNHHKQMVVRKAGRNAEGMDGQSVYVLRCTRAGCGHEYGEEGIRVHQRRCPKCDGGKAGLPVPPPEPTLFG
jgi:hypothetical protein